MTTKLTKAELEQHLAFALETNDILAQQNANLVREVLAWAAERPNSLRLRSLDFNVERFHRHDRLDRANEELREAGRANDHDLTALDPCPSCGAERLEWMTGRLFCQACGVDAHGWEAGR